VKDIPEDRDVTPEERDLTRWLLVRSGDEGAAFLDQMDRIRVISRCPCGCASVDFAVEGQRPSPDAKMHVIGEHIWQDAAGHTFGVFVFAKGGQLSGLEVWSVDGEGATPAGLPDVGRLRSLRSGNPTEVAAPQRSGSPPRGETREEGEGS
jgi:hypothetical protein